MSDIESQMKRLNTARKAVDDFKQMHTRLLGERDVHQSRLTEIESECLTKFSVKIGELPAEVERLESEANEAISKAEKLLGVSEEKSRSERGV